MSEDAWLTTNGLGYWCSGGPFFEIVDGKLVTRPRNLSDPPGLPELHEKRRIPCGCVEDLSVTPLIGGQTKYSVWRRADGMQFVVLTRPPERITDSD